MYIKQNDFNITDIITDSVCLDYIDDIYVEPSSLASDEVEFCGSINCANYIFWADLAQNIDTCMQASIKFTPKDIKEVQKRKHKKRRINKKWAKKYGSIKYVNNFNIDSISIVK